MPRIRLLLLSLLATTAILPLGTAHADSSGGVSAYVPRPGRANDSTGGAADVASPRPRVVPHPRPPARRPARRPVTHPPARRGGVFPVAGPHSFGGAGARFGAARAGHTHQGQDVLAAEGTWLRSPANGRVIYRAYQASGAGNYLVIHGTDRLDYVLMHMQSTPLVATGGSVRAGQKVGRVGHTGDAQGPHLHFEIWVGGWYAHGGHPIDPLPYLKRWGG